LALKSLSIEDKTFEISYEIINPACKKDIIFLHGWGSNKEVMKRAFLNYLKDFRHIYLDMPGFGKSPTKYILTTQDYAKICEEFLKQLNSSKDVIVGHSFGGKISTLLNPKNLVLLSSSGILEKKSFNVKLKIFFTKVFNTFGFKNFTKVFRSKDVDEMSENMYETFKNVVNEDFSSYFANFSNKALIFWGKEDKATSLKSGKIIANLIKNSKFISYSGEHYFFLEHSNDICERIEHGIS